VQLGSLYGLYRLLTYSHRWLETAHRHYYNWEKSQNDAVRKARNKEKAKERRKGVKSDTANDDEEEEEEEEEGGGEESPPEPEKTVRFPHPRKADPNPVAHEYLHLL